MPIFIEYYYKLFLPYLKNIFHLPDKGVKYYYIFVMPLMYGYSVWELITGESNPLGVSSITMMGLLMFCCYGSSYVMLTIDKADDVKHLGTNKSTMLLNFFSCVLFLILFYTYYASLIAIKYEMLSRSSIPIPITFWFVIPCVLLGLALSNYQFFKEKSLDDLEDMYKNWYIYARIFAAALFITVITILFFRVYYLTINNHYILSMVCLNVISLISYLTSVKFATKKIRGI